MAAVEGHPGLKSFSINGSSVEEDVYLRLRAATRAPNVLTAPAEHQDGRSSAIERAAAALRAVPQPIISEQKLRFEAERHVAESSAEMLRIRKEKFRSKTRDWDDRLDELFRTDEDGDGAGDLQELEERLKAQFQKFQQQLQQQRTAPPAELSEPAAEGPLPDPEPAQTTFPFEGRHFGWYRSSPP